MSILDYLLLAQLVSTLLMVGIIWFVQIVHYPLMAGIGPDRCSDYSRAHQKQTTWVVAGPMLVEVLSAIGILILSPALRTAPLFLVATALLALIWLTTTFLLVPLHESLLRGFDEHVIQRLVRTNWIRTFSWTLRGILIIWICSRSFITGI